MSTLREAAQQALEALEKYRKMMFVEAGCRFGEGDAAITALRAALAQQAEPRNQCGETCERARLCATCAQALAQQDEPVQDQRCRAEPRSDGDFACDCKIGECPGRSAEPAQEPVAWRFKPMIGSPWSLSDDGYYISCKRDKGYIVEPLYTAPPQRKPLTEEEIDGLVIQHAGYGRDNFYAVARAVERAHGIGEQP